MRHTTTTTLTTALLAALLTCPAVHAQDLAYFNTNTTAPAETPADVLVRREFVTNDLNTLATKKTKAPLARTVMLRADGLYEVRIVDALGHQRMHGTYLDSDLKVPHGDFQYNYPNGRLESTGAYRNGSKYGVWQCATATGQPRADRMYYGEWDELEVAVGLATRAQ